MEEIVTDKLEAKIPLKELEALEVVAYAARAYLEGTPTWVSLKASLDNLDSMREYPAKTEETVVDEEQLKLF